MNLESKCGMNVLALAKNGERFIFFWDNEPASAKELHRTLGRFAMDKELSFDWRDAAILSGKARGLIE